MSQNNSLRTLETLHDENRRLNAQVAHLQNRLARYEESEAETDAPQWNVWPYSWVIAAGDFCSDRFHSFHGKLIDARLTRRNQRSRRAYAMQSALAQIEATPRAEMLSGAESSSRALRLL